MIVKYISVAITAHYPRYENVISGSVMKFDDVQFIVGINNLSDFKSTGKFVCGKSGLYMISVSIMSYTSGAQFVIVLNGKGISSTYISFHDGNKWHTGTDVIAEQLQIGDNVWVQSTSNMFINNGLYSSFTIIKVK